MKQHNKYIVGIYSRLSRDDDNYSESESIINQKRMLTKYVEEQGWDLYDYYIDDGISGTTFNRPDFIRMIEDINNKKINLVITKDLSRLGRDYILTGHYIEVFFPEKNVRYIALNDGIDTYKNDNDIAPFKNILNEMYAKDISRKVRGAFRTKVEHGEFIGACAPYGYKKNPENKNKLIVDEPAAEVVKRIFNMAREGCGLNRIARVLNEESIPNPSVYKSLNGLAYVNNRRMAKTSYWTNSTIRKMLRNPVYVGTLAQGKQRTKSYKCKKKIVCSENDWVVVKKTHEAVVDENTWDEVQRELKIRRREMSNGETHLFSGMIKCEDCDRFMAFGRKNAGYEYFVCGTYKNYGPGYCSRHGIRYDCLCDIVLRDIKYHAELAQYDEDALVGKLIQADKLNKESFDSGLRKEAQHAEARMKEIDMILKQMYEDRVKGNLNERRFSQFSSQYEEEMGHLEARMKEIRGKLRQFEGSNRDVSYWLESIKKYTDVKELNKTVVNELIEKIVIGEKKNIGEDIYQDIGIYYKFVGCIS